MKLAYILVETREELIQKTCDRHLPFLPVGDLIVYTYKEHFNSLKNQLNKFKNNLILEEIHDRPFEVHNVNLLFTTKDFWDKHSNYDRVLIFQSDSEILKTGIEEFLEYDYIGAPWKTYDKHYFPYVGNGGLSLRNPKIISKILTNNTWGKDMGEDLFLCRCMINQNIGKLAPLEVAQKFSVESVFSLGTLGAHAIDKWLSKDECNLIRTQYDNI